MNSNVETIMLSRIDAMIEEFKDLGASDDPYDADDDEPRYQKDVDEEASQFLTGALDLMSRIAGPRNTYVDQSEKAIQNLTPNNLKWAAQLVRGNLRALRTAVASGYLTTASQLVHASVFSDLLEMAEHLLAEDYKDPAAVMIGGVLEAHIRKLCDSQTPVIPTSSTNAKGNLVAQTADSLNARLADAKVYSKLDQKNVTAWLGLRNSAAHGKFNDYEKKQVELLLQSVRDFVTRFPA